MPHIKLSFKIILFVVLPSILPLGLALLLNLIKFNQNILILIILSLATAGVFSLLLVVQITKPLKRILEGAQHLSTGSLNQTLDIRTGDELEELSRSINTMVQGVNQGISKIEQNRDLLTTERNRLEAILTSMTDGIIALDSSRKVLIINPAALNILGYSYQEIMGQPIDQLTRFYDSHSEVSPASYCPVNLGPLQPASYHSQGTIRCEGKNRKESFIKLTGSQVSTTTQTDLRCILILRDITHELEFERMKLDFVSMASHELRTPLTSIVGYISVFMDENKDKVNKDDMDLLDRAYISAKQMESLVENILNVSRIERGVLDAAITPIDWQAILTKSVSDLQNQAVQKNITLTLRPPEKQLPKASADSVLAAEVLNNLISNAIKYTPQSGRVDVFTQVTPDEIITTIDDNGPGIPKEAIPHLFTKFFRVSTSLGKGAKGTGLGLYISKTIIDKLRGRIWVESEEGKGSKFSFSLPLAKSTPTLDSLKGDLIMNPI